MTPWSRREANWTHIKGAATLSQKLQLDVQTSGYQKTTHIHQAIQTLQDFLIDLQMGALAMGWELAPDLKSLDEEMRWMGSYAAWYAAMQIFLYPENVLLPTLRPVANATQTQAFEIVTQTPAFRQLMKKLRETTELTPDEARTKANDYLTALKANYQNRGISLPSLLFTPILSSTPSFQITEQYTQSDLTMLLAPRSKELLDLVTGKSILPPFLSPRDCRLCQHI